MFKTSRRVFSIRARIVIPVGLVALVALGALNCGDDDAPAQGNDVGGASSAGAGGNTSAGAGGTNGAGTGGAAGVGAAGAAGTAGASGAAGAATADPLEITQGCVGQYVDLSSKADAERKIEAFGVSWTPNCVEITAGQSVKWDVDYTTHPLRKGVRGDVNAGTAGNPIPDVDGGEPVTVTFPTPGFYPFFCNYHATPDGKGMVGLVHVK